MSILNPVIRGLAIVACASLLDVFGAFDTTIEKYAF